MVIVLSFSLARSSSITFRYVCALSFLFHVQNRHQLIKRLITIPHRLSSHSSNDRRSDAYEPLCPHLATIDEYQELDPSLLFVFTSRIGQEELKKDTFSLFRRHLSPFRPMQMIISIVVFIPLRPTLLSVFVSCCSLFHENTAICSSFVSLFRSSSGRIKRT